MRECCSVENACRAFVKKDPCKSAMYAMQELDTRLSLSLLPLRAAEEVAEAFPATAVLPASFAAAQQRKVTTFDPASLLPRRQRHLNGPSRVGSSAPAERTKFPRAKETTTMVADAVPDTSVAAS